MSEFHKRLNDFICESLKNNYEFEKVDFLCVSLHSEKPREEKMPSLAKHLKQAFYSKGKKIKKVTRGFDLDGLAKTYDFLNDEYSKDLFIQLLVHRMLGSGKVKLPLDNRKSWEPVLEIGEKCSVKEFYNVEHQGQSWQLQMMDLNPLGVDLKYCLGALAVYLHYVLKQYAYDKGGIDFKVEKGDYVIDIERAVDNMGVGIDEDNVICGTQFKGLVDRFAESDIA